jgi:uracil phosphoribosyltransferase
MPSDRASLQALKNLLTETDLLISTTAPLPENRTPRCLELLRASLALTDDLLKQMGKPAAAIMGHKGGSETAKRGSEYFRKLASMRKTRAGGRPRKTDQ